MDVNIDEPKLETLDADIILHRPQQIISLNVTSQQNAEKEVKEMIGLITKHGLLLKLRKIVHISAEQFNYLDFNASTKSTVWCDVLICNPKTGSIIPNCKYIKRKGNELMFIHSVGQSYIGILIPVNFISNEDLQLLKIGDYVWIQCISVDLKFTSNKIYTSGKIYKLFDIPIEKRYIGFYNIKNDILNPFNLKLSQQGSLFEKRLGFDKNKEKYIKQLTDNLGTSWDKFYKHLVNPYELIKTRPGYLKSINLSDERPLHENLVSRAYYKIVEIIELFDFKSIVKSDKDLLVAIADAPGGFSQAMRHIFKSNPIMTTSLNLPQEIVYHPIITEDKSINIDFMETKTGDITDIRNIKYLHKKYSGKATIIAADGAFDHTQYPDYDNEILHNQLLFAEIVAALGMQKVGGNSCFKLYRRYSLVTIGIIYWTLQFYHGMIIYKPRSIRQANTESFVIFFNFKDIDREKILIPALNQIEKMKPQQKYTQFIETLFDDNFVPNNFINQVAKFNEYLDDVRIFSFESAIALNKNRNELAIKMMIKRQQELKTKFLTFKE